MSASPWHGFSSNNDKKANTTAKWRKPYLTEIIMVFLSGYWFFCFVATQCHWHTIVSPSFICRSRYRCVANQHRNKTNEIYIRSPWIVSTKSQFSFPLFSASCHRQIPITCDIVSVRECVCVCAGRCICDG